MLALVGILGCGAVRDLSPGTPRADSLVVYNAVEFGVASSVYFVVARVDGTAVHRKFDRDRGVRMAAGAHTLGLRFYTEGFASSPNGAALCEVSFAGEAARSYFVEGRAEGSRWGAALVSEDRARSWQCVFADSARRGAIVGGDLRLVESAVPTEPAPAAASVVGGATGTVVVGATGTVDPAPSEFVSGGVEGGIVGGRGRGGCPSGYFRVAAIEGEDLRLSGNETVRLLGVRVVDPQAFAAYVAPIVDQCVRLELDDAFAPLGHRDREGRLLAYVFLVGKRFLNADVIREGAARVDTRAKFRYLSTLMRAQSRSGTD